MSRVRLVQSKRRVAAALAVGGVVALLTAPAAHAVPVTVTYDCVTPIGKAGGTSPIDIKATKNGDSYKLVMSFEKGVSSSPVDLPKNVMQPTAKIKLGGAETGEVSVKGTTNAEAIPKETPIKLNDFTGTYTPKKTGKVTFTPGVLTIMAMNLPTTCTPKGNPGPALTLDVQAAASAGGTANGGSDNGGSDNGGSDSGGGSDGGSSLPQTGPADSAMALGTLGGTVLLAGTAGVLWLSRRRAGSRTAG